MKHKAAKVVSTFLYNIVLLDLYAHLLFPYFLSQESIPIAFLNS